MKRALTSIIFFLIVKTSFGQTLYLKDGIKLSYTREIKISQYCSERKKQIYYIAYLFTLTNSSGKTAKVTASAQIPNPVTSLSDYADCMKEDIVWKNSNNSDGSFEQIIKSGSQAFIFLTGWYFNQASGTPAFSIYYNFAKERLIQPQNTQTSQKPVNLPPVPSPKGKITSIYQNDVIVNPTDKLKQKYESQKIIEQQKASDALTMRPQANSIPQPEKNAQNLQKQQADQQQEQIRAAETARAEKLKAIQASLDQRAAEQQQRYNQLQIDFSNAQTASDNAYQTAIASGRKQSGAILESTLAGASQISDATNSLVYTGVGLSIALLAHFGEKKEERLEREAESRRAEARRLRVIEAKRNFISDALAINQYGFTDLMSKDRYAAILLVPESFIVEPQKAYFSIVCEIPKYADGTYPLKDEIRRKLLLSIDNSLLSGRKAQILYPIINIEKFQDEFTKKMGSGHLVYLNPELINFTKVPFSEQTNLENGIDFWGNPTNKKTEKLEVKPVKKENNFWNN